MRNAILTISSAAKTATSGKFGAVLKSTLFAVLLAAASMAGAVPIPGTPVPITLQTFVVMLAALMLPWKQAGAAVLMYLAAGAAGLPVFAGGASTMALVGPSAGFLIGFLPAAVVTSLLKGKARVDSLKHVVLTAARYLFACVAGCIVLRAWRCRWWPSLRWASLWAIASRRLWLRWSRADWQSCSDFYRQRLFCGSFLRLFAGNFQLRVFR